MTETPETPTPSLADELERCGWALHLELPAAVAVDVQKLTDAAAAQLRQLDRIKAELRGEHVPQWSTPEMEARGKDPIGCVMCWPQDGSWPCTTILTLEADDGA